MRVASLGIARPAFYDRNAASITSTYNTTVAPHVYTARFTYTVASGKKAIIETASGRISRQTAAAPVGIAYIECASLVGSDFCVHSYVYSIDNTLYVGYYNSSVNQVTLYAGESLRGATEDGSTGGTIRFYVGFKGTLFDA